MDTLELTHCPEVDTAGQACGALAEIIERYVLLDGEYYPLEHWKTRCLDGHSLNCPVSYFIEPDFQPQPSANPVEL